MKHWLVFFLFGLFLPFPVSSQHIRWLSDTANCQLLFQLFGQAALFGLDEKDYAYTTVRQVQSATVIRDTLSVDNAITDAATSFFSDIAYGRQANRITYNGLNYYPTCMNIRDSIVYALREHRLGTLASRLEPHNPMYAALKQQLAVLYSRLSLAATPVIAEQLDSTNHPLIERLYQLGITDSLNYAVSEDSLRNMLRKAQRMFEMLEDGHVRQAILEELNISMEKRLYELKQALNTWRWLNCIQEEEPVIIVDIPAANLFYLYKDSVRFYTRCIVGKPATPTTPLVSKVHEVILFPYWTVPHEIAVNELLPAIKGAPADYLDYGNYQVLDKMGKVVDPAGIKWQQLNKNNFPYTLRQLFGCDNSLGIIKLNFYSPYSTYLHDTPNKSYFLFNSRYFSHGCVRVENVDVLAEMLEPALHPFLANSPSTVCDLAAGNGQLIFPLKHPVPLFILYEVAWPDPNGVIRFYDDVYNKVKI
ncbi:L,D-transpeptidase family protein [Chitinophaga sp.]|uniref:L,D-transpeptidase family protein n=1 Tax=Chitinophaga sp. TaxID=1869181 RepID=UPI0031E0677D